MPSLVPPPSSSPGILRWASAAAAPSSKSWTDSRCCGAAGALVCQFLQILEGTNADITVYGYCMVRFCQLHLPQMPRICYLPSRVCRLASGFFYWSGFGRVYHGGFKATGLHLWRKDYTADLPAQAGSSAELLGHEGWERLGTDSNANRLEKCIMNLMLPLALKQDTSLQYHFIPHFWIPLCHSLISPFQGFPWRVGCILGPSGSGKSSNLKLFEGTEFDGFVLFFCVVVVFQQIWWSHGISDLSKLFSSSICFGKLFRFIWERARPLMVHLFWFSSQYQLYIVRKTPDGMKNTWLWEPWSRMPLCPSAFLPSNLATS